MNYELAKGELDQMFENGFADEHPELVIEMLKIQALENLKTSIEEEMKETRIQIVASVNSLKDYL